MEYSLRSQCHGNCDRRHARRGGGRHSHHGRSDDRQDSDEIQETVFRQRYVLQRVGENAEQPITEAIAAPCPASSPSTPFVRMKRWAPWIWICLLLSASVLSLVASQSQEARRVVGSYASPLTSNGIINRTLQITQIRRIYNFFTPVLPITSSQPSSTKDLSQNFHKSIALIQQRLAEMEVAMDQLRARSNTFTHEQELGQEIAQLREIYNTLLQKVDNLLEEPRAKAAAGDNVAQLLKDLSTNDNSVSKLQGEGMTWKIKIEALMAANEKIQRELAEIRSRIESIVKADCQTCAAGSATAGPVTLDDVNHVISAAIAKYDADKTGLPDYALESGGGSIVGVRCTETYAASTRQETLFGIPLWYKEFSPRTVIQAGFAPGECWPFKGSHGYLVIRLSGLVEVTAVSYEHISKNISPTGNIDSAPKRFEVHALANQDDEEGLKLGQYTYDANGQSLQFFPVQVLDAPATNIIELRVLSNYGHPVYTCVYRFRVHGRRVEASGGSGQ